MWSGKRERCRLSRSGLQAVTGRTLIFHNRIRLEAGGNDLDVVGVALFEVRGHCRV